MKGMVVFYWGGRDAWGGLFHRLAHHLEAEGDQVELLCASDLSVPPSDRTTVLISTSPRVDDGVFEALGSLRLVQQAGAGLESIDREAARRRGVAVANVPTDVSGASRAVAEHALGLMLSLTREHRRFGQEIADGQVGRLVAETLFGKVVGIVGLGAIGRRLAALLLPFQCDVMATTRSGTTPAAVAGVRWLGAAQDLPALLKAADFVVLTCPLEPATRHMINRDSLSLCKPGTTIINVARGALIDHTALLEALNESRIKAAGLDVFDGEPIPPSHPLLAHPNAIVSPHVAAVTATVVDATARVIVTNVRRTMAGNPPLHQVL